jgi:hypothetical protein
MRERLTTGLFVLVVALQPLSTWTLLGIFGTDHWVRGTIVEGAIGLVVARRNALAHRIS